MKRTPSDSNNRPKPAQNQQADATRHTKQTAAQQTRQTPNKQLNQTTSAEPILRNRWAAPPLDGSRLKSAVSSGRRLFKRSESLPAKLETPSDKTEEKLQNLGSVPQKKSIPRVSFSRQLATISDSSTDNDANIAVNQSERPPQKINLQRLSTISALSSTSDLLDVMDTIDNDQ